MALLPFFISLAVLVQISRSSKESTPINRPRDPTVPLEYCELEVFQPSCWKGEVIVMRSAFYGRMRIGQCVEADLGYLGCSADVLKAADRKCSGRQSCSISIPDADFDATKPCYKELKMYLDASYSCQKVAEDDRGCSVFVTSNPPLPVSLPSYSKFGCGSKGQPWVVEVVSGQRLNVTLLDFQFYGPSTALGENVPESQPGPVRGLLIDRAAGTNLTVQADLTEQRERWIYQSKGNSLEVYVSPSKDQQGWPDAGYEFLFRFEAVGCADLRPPGDAWIRRDGNELTVGCHSTRQTWHLQCQGQRWTGVIGNCTSTQLAAKKEALVNSEASGIPHALAIATVAGVALTLCLLIVCIGIFVLRRFAKQDRLRDLAKAALQYENTDSDDEIVQAYYTRSKPENVRPSATADSSAYSHVWELPLPEPAEDAEDGDCGQAALQRRSVSSASAGVTTALPGEKQDVAAAYNASAASARSDETRYFVLDRSVASPGVNSGSGVANPGAGANSSAVQGRC